MEDYEKDAFEREIERVDVKIGLSIRGYLPQILPALLVSAYTLFVLSKIPAKGLAVKYLFKFNILTPLEVVLGLVTLFILNKISMGRKNILAVFILSLVSCVLFMYFKMSNMMISYDVFQYALLPLAAASIGVIIYYILYAKTANIIANKRFVQISKGVLNRVNDSTNLSKLQDEDLEQSTLDLILGLGKVILEISRNKKIVFEKITIKDAQRLHRFIKANAFGQSREYWQTRDRINERINSDKASNKEQYKYIDDGADEGDQDIDYDGGPDGDEG